MAGRRTTSGPCAYCGEHCDSLEQEHVFPASWHPTTTPAHHPRIKVPSCSDCNRAFGRIEERLQRQWALCIDVSFPEALGIWDRVRHSFDPGRSRTPRDARMRTAAREKTKRSVRCIGVSAQGRFPGMGALNARWMRQESGLYGLASDAVIIDASDVSAFTKKLVRGLHYATFNEPLRNSVPIETFVVGEEAWPAVRAQLDRMTPRGTPPGFLFWRGEVVDHPSYAVWYFLIWGQVFLQASTVPKEWPPPVAPA